MRLSLGTNGKEGAQEVLRLIFPTSYIAELDDKIVRYVAHHLDRERKMGEVGNNAVASRYQRRGIARSCQGRLLKHLRRKTWNTLTFGH